MKKLIQIFAIIALLIFIITSIPKLVEIMKEWASPQTEKKFSKENNDTNDEVKKLIEESTQTLNKVINENLASGLDENFIQEKNERYKATIKKLEDIRRAIFAYKNFNGNYTSDWDSIISFLSNSRTDLVNVNEDLKDGNQLKYIPNTERTEFNLDVGHIISKNGTQVLVFQVSAHNNSILNGLNPMSIIQLNQKLRMNGKYPGLRIGSLEEDNKGAGNWEY